MFQIRQFIVYPSCYIQPTASNIYISMLLVRYCSDVLGPPRPSSQLADKLK